MAVLRALLSGSLILNVQIMPRAISSPYKASICDPFSTSITLPALTLFLQILLNGGSAIHT